ncbi:MAG: GCN5 family acetyltransferase [Pseudomonadota bacterium]
MSKYPVAVSDTQIGEYPAGVKAGGGYFFDAVLEYRVWCHPEDDDDHFYAFSTYEDALTFSENTQHAEEPLVLIKQLEWIDEPAKGQFKHLKGERIAEWLPEWLSRGSRKPGDIEDFIKEKLKK